MQGVYAIRNKLTGGQYVGSAVSIEKRWHSHRCLLRAGTHKNRQLQAAWNANGESNFEFRIVILCSGPDLLVWEQKTMDETIQSGCPLYNLAPSAGTTAGIKNTPEARARMSAAKQNISESTRQKIRESKLGHVVSEETRKKISDSTKGRKLPPEQLAKRYGRQASPATREKIRAARRATYLKKNHLYFGTPAEKTKTGTTPSKNGTPPTNGDQNEAA